VRNKLLSHPSNNNIRAVFIESIKVKEVILKNNSIDRLIQIGEICKNAIMAGKKIMFCGNGGSAADAQHLAAELLIRLRPKFNREGIMAMSLLQDTSTITACGNDFGFEYIFERNLITMGNKGDILIAITTSGNSINIINAIKAAKEMGIYTVGFLGGSGGEALGMCDNYFLVPSNETGRIQESHITAGHAMMEYIEDKLIENEFIKLK
jgi:D-sedoheptulose 7-phosphate isomerase